MAWNKRIKMRELKSLNYILLLSINFYCNIALTQGSDSIKYRCGFQDANELRGYIKPHVVKQFKNRNVNYDDSAYYIVPVVFHVIYATSGQGPDALSNTDIMGQI